MRIRNICAFIFAITLFTSVACAQILQVKPVDEVTEVIPSDITFTGEPADETASPDPTDEPITPTVLVIETDADMERFMAGELEVESHAYTVVLGDEVTMLPDGFMNNFGTRFAEGYQVGADDPDAFFTLQLGKNTRLTEQAVYGLYCFDSIEVPPDSLFHDKQDGIIYDRESGVALYCDTAVQDAIIRDGTKRIGSYAFSSTELTSVELPNGIESIGFSAFSGTKIQSVFLPDTVQLVEGYAFENCFSLHELRLSPNMVFDEATSDEYYFGQTQINRVIVTGDKTNIDGNACYEWMELEQLVFLTEQPCSLTPEEIRNDTTGRTKTFYANTDYFETVFPKNMTVYYLNTYKDSWSPNGEIEWNGRRMVGIDSVDELPSLETTWGVYRMFPDAPANFMSIYSDAGFAEVAAEQWSSLRAEVNVLYLDCGVTTPPDHLMELFPNLEHIYWFDENTQG